MRVGWASMGSIISKRTKSFYLIGIFALRLHQVAPRHFIAGGIEFNKKLVEDCRLGSHQDPTSYSFQISPFWTFTCTTKLLGILQILQSSAPGGTKSWKEKMCSMFSALQFFNICYPLVNTKKQSKPVLFPRDCSTNGELFNDYVLYTVLDYWRLSI